MSVPLSCEINTALFAIASVPVPPLATSKGVSLRVADARVATVPDPDIVATSKCPNEPVDVEILRKSPLALTSPATTILSALLLVSIVNTEVPPGTKIK